MYRIEDYKIKSSLRKREAFYAKCDDNGTVIDAIYCTIGSIIYPKMRGYQVYPNYQKGIVGEYDPNEYNVEVDKYMTPLVQ